MSTREFGHYIRLEWGFRGQSSGNTSFVHESRPNDEENDGNPLDEDFCEALEYFIENTALKGLVRVDLVKEKK